MQERNIHGPGIDQGSRIFCGTAGFAYAPIFIVGASENAASWAALKSGTVDSHTVNTKDCGRCKKGTYMGPAWPKDQERSVAQQDSQTPPSL